MKDALFGAAISRLEVMREKARFVLGAMEMRMAALGFGWADVTATQVYTIFDIHLLLADEFVRRGAIPGSCIIGTAAIPITALSAKLITMKMKSSTTTIQARCGR
jgi:hypothetical protein